MRTHHYDVAIVGAGFAGLNCARAAARRGLRVLVLERKSEPGQRVHTTGLLVKEAAERWEIPATLTRRVRGVRLHSPALTALDLEAAGYYFLATDTPALMRWLAREAARAGAHLRFGRPYRGARRTGDGFELVDGDERVRDLVGADGPHSAVAAEFGLGRNTEFLLGIEAEYEGIGGHRPRSPALLSRRTARARLHRLGGARLRRRRAGRPRVPAPFQARPAGVRGQARLAIRLESRAPHRAARRAHPGGRPRRALRHAWRGARRRRGRPGVAACPRAASIRRWIRASRRRRRSPITAWKARKRPCTRSPARVRASPPRSCCGRCSTTAFPTRHSTRRCARARSPRSRAPCTSITAG